MYFRNAPPKIDQNFSITLIFPLFKELLKPLKSIICIKHIQRGQTIVKLLVWLIFKWISEMPYLTLKEEKT